MRRLFALALVFALASACGASHSSSRGRPDIVTSEWTEGDDAVLATPRPPTR